ncbi:54S ribosomal protein L1, mitochondrial [Neolecta irregularis DAH-3]|uniref:Ribosomal protein n=1 Tax=Neolecta irregularis (strain DAH-3) TaxID=1198029 RepID=A0A1U7LGR0_NEOID|nr:54S ribosomal protein L1, mitochondrial [Neolecta irregularis DAH-3]|eukprot:OLL21783.1 54S ribosomal protein L1, mitochondrial [Neolecta irregularis DAH-3]
MSLLSFVLQRPAPLRKWICPSCRSYAKRSTVDRKALKEKEFSQHVPLKSLTVSEAARYLRAAEIGYPCHSSAISLDVRLRTEKGVAPVRGSVKLPHSIASKPKVCVFATGKHAQVALKAGADFVGGEELVEKVKGGFLDFDKCYAHPDMLSLLKPLGKILGPKGLMPSAKRGTVTINLVHALRVAEGKIDFREKGGHVRMKIAKIDFRDSQIQENVQVIIENVRAGQEKIDTKVNLGIEEISLTSTNGPGIPLVGFS